MSDEERVDLSPLGPAGEAHWQRVMAATMARVEDVLAHRNTDPLTTIAAWRRPLLAAAAAAVALLIPVELALETRETAVEQVERLVSLSLRWSHGETVPSGAEFLRALATEDAP
jgi:hypothetical protein